MKKSILDLGMLLNRADQKQIVGGYGGDTPSCGHSSSMSCTSSCAGICVPCTFGGWQCIPSRPPKFS